MYILLACSINSLYLYWIKLTLLNLAGENESPVLKALRQASSRPVYHKSMEDISLHPSEDQLSIMSNTLNA